MFGILKITPTEMEGMSVRITSELRDLADKGTKSDLQLFLTAAAVLHANFKGKYNNIDNFKALSDTEKGDYLKAILQNANPALASLPPVKLAHLYYSTLIQLEAEGSSKAVSKMQLEFREIIHASK